MNSKNDLVSVLVSQGENLAQAGAMGVSTLSTEQLLSNTVKAFKSRVSRVALEGAVIAAVAVILASFIAGYYASGSVSLQAALLAQKNNIALWVLDMTPFFFSFWGQYSSTVMAYQASAMVMDQTSALRIHAATLEVQAQHSATHDMLTDLPNRLLFHDRVEQAISYAKRNNGKMALLVMDIDDFQEINNTLGHFNGDILLKQVASRLRSSVREPDTVARLGGDEFAVLLPELESAEAVRVVADKLVDALRQSYVLGGVELDAYASIGSVTYPEFARDVDSLLQKADIAMYVAKQQRGFSYVEYQPECDQHSTTRLSLSGELRRAIEQGELWVYYQPKVAIDSGQIKAVEALVRWPHPQHGLLLPDEFIGLAEHTGLIQPLTEFVLSTAVAQCAEWQRQGLRIGMAVNISARVLLQSEFPDLVAGLLAASGLEPSALVLEITESSIMEDQVRALENVTRLSEQGMRISIDDFGTGYSSLAYLRSLPVNEIKIDKSFVMRMLESENDAVIVRATIGLAHNLGLSVIAEGVEDDKLWQLLKQQGCDLAQGFYISEAVPAEDITHMLLNPLAAFPY